MCLLLFLFFFFFFFQAEDGIRDGHVTGVQTCALPILSPVSSAATPRVSAAPSQAGGTGSRLTCRGVLRPRAPAAPGAFLRRRCPRCARTADRARPTVGAGPARDPAARRVAGRRLVGATSSRIRAWASAAAGGTVTGAAGPTWGARLARSRAAEIGRAHV